MKTILKLLNALDKVQVNTLQEKIIQKDGMDAMFATLEQAGLRDQIEYKPGKGFIEKKRSKLFFWKDKSGRGFARSFQLQDLLNFQDEQNWDGDDLKTWAQDAEEGDTFENAANLITCTRA